MTKVKKCEKHDTSERYYADMESARIYHEHEYFKARPALAQTELNQSLFRAGFERGFKFLWQRFVDAEADMLRIHNELVDAKYPSRPADETTPHCECGAWTDSEGGG